LFLLSFRPRSVIVCKARFLIFFIYNSDARSTVWNIFLVLKMALQYSSWPISQHYSWHARPIRKHFFFDKASINYAREDASSKIC
jgi:hypothetical protein